MLGGFILAAIGAFVLAQSFRYGLGTPRRMGAGYFPMVLGITATLIGVLIMIRSFGRETAFQPIDWRPAIFILAAIGYFGLTIRTFGMIPAIAGATLLAALGDRSARPRSTAVLVVCVSIGVWLVFVVGLRLPVPAFGSNN